MRDKGKTDERLGRANVMLACAAGLFAAVAILAWGVPGLDPSLWDETAIAAGIRPPRHIFPGLWRIITSGLFSCFGIDLALKMLTVVGAALAGVCTALVFTIVRQALALLVRTGKAYPAWYSRIAPFFALVAAILFGVSDPLCVMARVFSPEELRMVILLVCIHLMLRWLSAGGNWRIFTVMSLMGIMAAETPFAFVMPIMLLFAYVSTWHRIMDGIFVKPDLLPTPSEMPKWRMFFLFLGGLVVGVVLNAGHFMAIGGLEANGWSANDIYFRYAGGYWHVMTDAATLLGWVLGLGFGVFPLVVSLRLFPLLARDDKPMIFDLGISMFFIGVMAVMQSGAFPAARFWTFARESVVIHSSFLLVFFVFCAMVAVALAGAAFAFECQRTYLADGEAKPGFVLRWLVPALAAVLVVMAVMHLPKPVETEMQRIVDESVEETVRECGDAKFLFTDGHFDAAVELAAARAGKNLKALSMMSGPSSYEINMRCRHFDEDSEDRRTVETGVPALLRVWAGEKPHGLDEAALQLGFEFWKRDNKPLPPMSGMVARTTGFGEAERKRGIEAANALSERILAVSPDVENADPSHALADALWAVNWRLSRFARYREDADRADMLDKSNGALTKMLTIMEYERLRTFMQMTPREGLQLALRRADFAEARRYSTSVLRYDEDDPEANFAMGMGALMARRFEEAEMYLKRVLKRRPDEPAVLNNLSIICRKKRRWQEAEEYARKAIAILPNSPEVKQTLSDALKKAP